MPLHYGQVLRVYDAKRYTIWDLDGAERAIPCYSKLKGKDIPPEPGDIVMYVTTERQDCATAAMIADPSELTPAQIKNLVVSSLGNTVEPIGNSQKAHSRK